MAKKTKKKAVKKKPAKKNNRLLRYTSLPVLLDILSKNELTLLDPESWDDRNDSFYLEVYRKEKKLKTLLAICFTTGPETYHHWKVFSAGSSGVCIRFKRQELLRYLNSIEGIKYRTVKYRLIRTLQSKCPKLEELPFRKRKPFKDEKEFRIIYENKNKEMKTIPIGIGLECIEEINLSPWMPDSVSTTVKHVVNSIKGCSGIRVSKSKLLNSKQWCNIAKRIYGE